MKKVMVFGTFDGLHPGHLDLFRQARELGDYLIVVVAHDETVNAVKGKYPSREQSERVAEIEKSERVDKVIAAMSGQDKMQVIGDNKPDVICLGYDQRAFVSELEEYVDSHDVEIVRAKSLRPDVYKSSKMKNI